MSCLMNGPEIVDGVLSEDATDDLWGFLADGAFEEYPLGDGVEMYVCGVPEGVREEVQATLEERLGKKLVEISQYARYNSPDADNLFRIHSDGEILGVQPDIASVLYLTEGGTGTALFSHPIYGDEPFNAEATKVFTVDDDDWEMTFHCEEVCNRLFVYDAKKFHSRHPYVANNERFVIVSFFKEA